MDESLLYILLFALFISPVYAKNMSFKWQGVIPVVQSEMNAPVNINRENINKVIKEKSWLIEDAEQKGKHDNEHGVVRIITISI